MKKASLILENGARFEGYSFGAEGTAEGVLTVETNVVGYLEALTDAENEGKLLLQTFPLIGNYGMIPADVAAKAAPCGYIVRECCDAPSNFRCGGPLSDWLKGEGVVGIAGIDTRAVTRILRENGAMTAKIVCEEVETDAAE